MKPLFIAEKPSMARSIAKHLKGPHSNKDGYIETSEAYVTWCIGHLLETAPPDAYDPKYEKFPWKFEDLPILPQEWKLQVSGDKHKQVKAIKDLLKQCNEVVNAGDPGREGQLIIDELLQFLNNKKPVKRILLNALDDTTIKRELKQLHDNKQFEPLYQAGLGRQRADWLVGMNLSRAYSILGSQAGFRGVLSVGRVQSPTLAIIVKRDRDIESFVPKDYWTIKAKFETSNQEVYLGSWVAPGQSTEEDGEDGDPQAPSPSTNPQTWLDEHHRIIDGKMAQSIVDKINGKKAKIIDYQRNRTQEKAPLPFDLSAIQILANSKWSASVQETLQACQNLYEKGVTTYPRTDCSYLPESQHSEASIVIEAISQFQPLSSLTANADLSIKSQAWNDAKMGEHHAIIPTREKFNPSNFSDLECKIYQVIAQRYLAQFYPSCEVDKTKIITEVENEKFVTRGRLIVNPGWRVIFSQADFEDQEETVPLLQINQTVDCKNGILEAKKTQPPARFTQGTLLKAMKEIHTVVDDPVLKKKLKSVEGIGRSATRASIIETLIKRSFVETKQKQLISTPVGRALIDALPSRLIDPALTAMWETALDSVAQGKTSLDAFMAKQTQWLIQLVDSAKQSKIENLPASIPSKPGNSSSATKTNQSSPKKSSSSGSTTKNAKTCPKCNKGQMVQRTIKNGQHAGKTFLGCSNFPECKHSEFPK